jgi:hypothetical protein
MELKMDLSKKTTILFPPELHDHLASRARQQNVSLGHLVRSACEAQYGFRSTEDRLRAVRELCAMSAPVGNVSEMKRESVPKPEELLP